MYSIEGTQGLTPSIVYSILTLVQLLKIPLRTFLSSLNSIQQGRKSLKRIQHLLVQFYQQNSQQFKPIVNNNWKFQIVYFKNAVFTWHTLKSQKHHRTILKKQAYQKYPSSAMNISQKQPQSIQEIGKEKKIFVMRLNFKFEKGNTYLILGKTGSGKSSLIHAILGNMNLKKGDFGCYGKISYLSQNIWLQHASIKNNIIFYEQYNSQWYKKVLQITQVNKFIVNFPKKDEQILLEGIQLSSSQQKKICLARSLYSKSDIYLLDSCFSGIGIGSIKSIYNSIKRQLKDSIIIITTHTANFADNNQYIILLRNGEIVQHQYYDIMKLDRNSYLHQIEQDTENDFNKENKINKLQEKLQLNQQILKNNRIKIIQVKVKAVIKLLSFVIKGRNQSEKLEIIQKIVNQNLKQKKKKQQITRIQGIKFKQILGFMKISSVSFYLILILFIGGSQTANILGEYYIGTIKQSNNNNYFMIWIIIGLSVIEVVFYGSIFFVIPFLALKTTQKSLSILLRTMLYVKQQFFNTQPPVKCSQRISRVLKIYKDNYQMFQQQLNISTLLNNIFMFIGIIIIASIVSYLFSFIAIIVSSLNLLISYIFLLSIRQVYQIRLQAKYSVYIKAQQANSGIYLIKAFRKHRQFYQVFISNQQMYRKIKKFSIAKSNYRVIFSSMKLLNSLLSLFVVIGVLVFAIRKKIDFDNDNLQGQATKPLDVALIGSSITFALNSCTILQLVSVDIVQIQVLLKKNWKSIIDFAKQAQLEKDEVDQLNNYFPFWFPRKGILSFNNVQIQYPNTCKPIIQSSSVVINHSEIVFLYGKIASGKTTLLKAICNQIPLDPDTQQQKRTIQIDNINIIKMTRESRIFQLGLMKIIVYLFEYVFLFKGTLRENLDPFIKYSNNQIIQALELAQVNQILFKKKQLNQKHLDFKISEGGDNISNGCKQQINFARLFLVYFINQSKPKIILLDNASTYINPMVNQIIEKNIKQHLSSPTIIKVTDRIIQSAMCSMIMIIDEKIVQYDTPFNLINNQNSYYYKLIQEHSLLKMTKEKINLFKNLIQKQKENQDEFNMLKRKTNKFLQSLQNVYK